MKKLTLALMLACLLAPASSRAQNAYMMMGVAVTPDSTKVYVANDFGNTVSVIDAATHSVIATIPVGNASAGVIIQPAPRFAGVPGSNNCQRTSVSALAAKFRGLDTAAAALRLSVKALQDAIRAFCEG